MRAFRLLYLLILFLCYPRLQIDASYTKVLYQVKVPTVPAARTPSKIATHLTQVLAGFD